MENEIELLWQKKASEYSLLQPIDQALIKSTFFTAAMAGYQLGVKVGRTATGEYETAARDYMKSYFESRTNEIDSELKLLERVRHETKGLKDANT